MSPVDAAADVRSQFRSRSTGLISIVCVGATVQDNQCWLPTDMRSADGERGVLPVSDDRKLSRPDLAKTEGRRQGVVKEVVKVCQVTHTRWLDERFYIRHPQADVPRQIESV